MDTYDSSCATHGSGEIGIGVAQHVYGPASVHLLPCKIHHTGHAPVATYFRPRPPRAEGRTKGQPATCPVNDDANGDKAEDGGASRERLPQSSTADSNGESLGGSARAGCDAREKAGDSLGGVADGEGRGGAVGEAPCADDQKWENLEEDAAEHIARFRGRKFVGRKVELPEGVHGVVLREKPCPEGVRRDNEDLTSYWAAETSFRDVMVWGHDQARRESTVDRGLAWLEISKSIHDP